jgi:hypothetical protein
LLTTNPEGSQTYKYQIKTKFGLFSFLHLNRTFFVIEGGKISTKYINSTSDNMNNGAMKLDA